MIYLDLDETLIHSLPGQPGLESGKRTEVTVGIKENGKPDTYHTQKRQHADLIITRCKELAPVAMLTTATKAYAIEMDRIFNLGFGQNIIANEDYLMDVQIAYGWDTLVTAVNIDKAGILIDNNPVTAKHAMLKIKALGIPKEHYYQIREYEGGKDPIKFETELEAMFMDIQTKLPPIPTI